MSNFLQMLLMGAPAPIDSAAQLRAAQAQTYTSQAEKAARAAGFPNAAAMALWTEQRNRQRAVQTIGKAKPGAANVPRQPANANSGNILGFVYDKIRAATGQ